ncbi:cytochrome P450 4C1-like [Belonocnema kinseyi]|uniref:cytochrome P450 4C1-like n=1 Tax=Belonocnema kinseyi TaxID=2817044 RepID=UPI00143D46E9|nr:cytochrome P450 4C1-like [Belonocnema kinseyi]
MQIIKKRKEARKALKNIPTNDEGVDETGKRKKKALLDLLLNVNETEQIPMTDSELKEQVETFIFAGHDTTGAAVSWTVFNLANNPEVQEKVHQELDQIFGDSTERATMKQITELKYLDRVIKENLRLNPSVPIVGRTLTKDIVLDGHLLPSGCNLIIDIFNLHRDPEVWNCPLKFDPNRFLLENCRGRHSYAYVPFSAGPRNCIGQKFAMIELKIVLTALLRKWRLKSARTQAEMKMHSTFVLRPHDGNPNYFTLKSEKTVNS